MTLGRREERRSEGKLCPKCKKGRLQDVRVDGRPVLQVCLRCDYVKRVRKKRAGAIGGGCG
jgi:hypothetical protein